jgi:endoglucanase
LELEAFLRGLIAVPGLSGNELPVARYLQDAFAPYCPDPEIDAMQNLLARLPGEPGGPKVMVTAHMDEIGLCVDRIEDDGSLRLVNIGGVDPRILPGSEVLVLCDPPLPGIVGAKPPHLLNAADQKKNYKREDIYVDVGYPPEAVRQRVQVGDRVQLVGPLQTLAEGRVAGKTMDDRACVAILWLAARQLATMRHAADIHFVCACQEEVGGHGARTACYTVAPDLAVAVDVTHGPVPDSRPDQAHPLDKVIFSKGPNLHPKLLEQVLQTARNHRVDTQVSICPHVTWTDAAVLQVSREGVPTVLMELPLKYMHTTVELCDLHTVREAARLLVAFLAGLGTDWRDGLCF